MATRKEEVEFIKRICTEMGWEFIPSHRASHPYTCREFVAVRVPLEPYGVHLEAIDLFRQSGPGWPLTEEHTDSYVLFWQHLEMPSMFFKEKGWARKA